MAGMQLVLLVIWQPFLTPLLGEEFLGLIDFALDEDFLKISLMASACSSTGWVRPIRRNRPQTPKCASTASLFLPPFFAISSSTASAHRPQIHRPVPNLSRTRRMYSGVHSSDTPQHSHLASSTSLIAGSAAASPTAASFANWNERSDTARCRPSMEIRRGRRTSRLFLEATSISPLGAIGSESAISGRSSCTCTQLQMELL